MQQLHWDWTPVSTILGLDQVSSRVSGTTRMIVADLPLKCIFSFPKILTTPLTDILHQTSNLYILLCALFSVTPDS